MSWMRFFKKNEDIEENEDELDQGQSFSFNEHMRIVLAMIIVLISALVMWWILM